MMQRNCVDFSDSDFGPLENTGASQFSRCHAMGNHGYQLEVALHPGCFSCNDWCSDDVNTTPDEYMHMLSCDIVIFVHSRL